MFDCSQKYDGSVETFTFLVSHARSGLAFKAARLKVLKINWHRWQLRKKNGKREKERERKRRGIKFYIPSRLRAINVVHPCVRRERAYMFVVNGLEKKTSLPRRPKGKEGRKEGKKENRSEPYLNLGFDHVQIAKAKDLGISWAAIQHMKHYVTLELSCRG